MALEREWADERNRHEDQVQPWRFLRPRVLRSSATLTPAPLRFFAFAPPRAWLLTVGLVVLIGFFVQQLYLAEVPVTGRDALGVVALIVLVLLLSVSRISVSDHGLSFDIVGVRRVSCYGFVPLSAIREVAVGAAPGQWPRVRSASTWRPGAQRVVLLIAQEDGGRRARSLWVRDVGAFTDALRRGPAPRRRR